MIHSTEGAEQRYVTYCTSIGFTILACAKSCVWLLPPGQERFGQRQEHCPEEKDRQPIGATSAGDDKAGAGNKNESEGKVSVEGVAEKLETLMEGFLVSTTGIFDSRIGSLSTQLTSITDDRADLARRMQSLEDRYFAQLNAMDSLLAEIETTGDFLTQQFEAMKPRKD